MWVPAERGSSNLELQAMDVADAGIRDICSYEENHAAGEGVYGGSWQGEGGRFH